jgi:hypothetical protein
LAKANAPIAYLEAKLKASQKAWDVATAAKATAEKLLRQWRPRRRKWKRRLLMLTRGAFREKNP